MLTFEPIEHVYHWNGERVPSVTQVLEPLFDWSRVPAPVLARKALIGTAVHAAIHLDLQGLLDEDSIDPQCLGYFMAWRRFCNECAFEPILTEYRVYDAQHRYCGTPDAYGPLQHRPALIDWKTAMSLNHPAVGSQTAAYLSALVHNGIASLSDRRFALQLGRDGRYELHPYTALHTDMQRFLKYRRAHVG